MTGWSGLRGAWDLRGYSPITRGMVTSKNAATARLASYAANG
jgi:hypothetical protein